MIKYVFSWTLKLQQLLLPLPVGGDINMLTSATAAYIHFLSYSWHRMACVQVTDVTVSNLCTVNSLLNVNEQFCATSCYVNVL